MMQHWKYKAYPQEQVITLARRVNTEWAAYKQQHKITQEEFAEEIGVTQPAFNQFIKGKCPINNEMILTLCYKFGIKATDLTKDLSFFSPFFVSVGKTVIHRTVENQEEVFLRYKIGSRVHKERPVEDQVVLYSLQKSNTKEDIYGVEIADNIYEPRYRKGDVVIVEETAPVKDDIIFIVKADNRHTLALLVTDLDYVSLKSTQACVDRTPQITDDGIVSVHKVIGMKMR